MDNVPNENYGGNSETLHNSDGVNNELKIGEKYQQKIANDKNKTRHEIYTNSINHQIELNEIDEFDFDLDNINSPVNDNHLKPGKRFFNFTFDENSFLPSSVYFL
ncbi:conserved Plasmodium protein, unknown function [Plasmodium vinckei brucechwatti]|uniref:Uncharacterized protein n=1 Tax=Plasmodium vinckei brucechwatti TaxID=119398 RepID=A0A6V7S966_PLAVN|nr:conserved Plasmodium protein, unknown function [Plasmodium vinckei brucechwatti]